MTSEALPQKRLPSKPFHPVVGKYAKYVRIIDFLRKQEYRHVR